MLKLGFWQSCFRSQNWHPGIDISDSKYLYFLVAEQLYVWSCLSVRLFVCLSQMFVPDFVPNFCPEFCPRSLNVALQFLLDNNKMIPKYDVTP